MKHRVVGIAVLAGLTLPGLLLIFGNSVRAANEGANTPGSGTSASLARSTNLQTLAIISDPSFDTYGTLLTASLSKAGRVNLVERDAILNVLSEQKLAAREVGAARGLQLGRMLKADAVLLIAQAAGGLSARLILVRSGVVLGTISTPGTPQKKPQEPGDWASLVTAKIHRHLDRFHVRRDQAVPLSVLNFRSTVPSDTGLEAELKFGALLNHYLILDPRIFLLERERMGVLHNEKEWSAETATDFWPGTYLVDGFIEPDLQNPGLFRVVAQLTNPKTKAQRRLERAGTIDQLASTAEELAGEIFKAVSVAPRKLAGDLQTEARAFADESGWFYRQEAFRLAAQAAESAYALGVPGSELAHRWMASLIRLQPFVTGTPRSFRVTLNTRAEVRVPYRRMLRAPLRPVRHEPEKLHAALRSAVNMLHRYRRLVDGWEGAPEERARFARKFGPPTLDAALAAYKESLADSSPMNQPWKDSLKDLVKAELERFRSDGAMEETPFLVECIKLHYAPQLMETDRAIIPLIEHALTKSYPAYNHKPRVANRSDIDVYFDYYRRTLIPGFPIIKDLVCELVHNRPSYLDPSHREWDALAGRLQQHERLRVRLVGLLFEHDRSAGKAREECLKRARRWLQDARDDVTRNPKLYPEYADTLYRIWSRHTASFKRLVLGYWRHSSHRAVLYTQDYRKFMTDYAVYIYENGPYLPAVPPPFRQNYQSFSAHDVKRFIRAWERNLTQKGMGQPEHAMHLRHLAGEKKQINDRLYRGLFNEPAAEDSLRMLAVRRSIAPIEHLSQESSEPFRRKVGTSRFATLAENQLWTVIQASTMNRSTGRPTVDFHAYVVACDFERQTMEAIPIPFLEGAGATSSTDMQPLVEEDGLFLSRQMSTLMAWYSRKAGTWQEYRHADLKLYSAHSIVTSKDHIYAQVCAREHDSGRTIFPPLGILRMDKHSGNAELIMNFRRKPAQNPVEQHKRVMISGVDDDDRLVLTATRGSETNFFSYHPSDSDFKPMKPSGVPDGFRTHWRDPLPGRSFTPEQEDFYWMVGGGSPHVSLRRQRRGTDERTGIPLAFSKQPDQPPSLAHRVYLPNWPRVFPTPSGLAFAGTFKSSNTHFFFVPHQDIEDFISNRPGSPAIHREGMKPMEWFEAVLGGQVDVLKNLIADGADINQRNGDQLTALMLAAKNDLHEVADFLIRNHANLGLKGPDGQTALRYATRAADIETYNRLLKTEARKRP